jgi:mRNA interferase MazF
VQADGLVTQLPQVVVAMITSNLERATHPSRVLLLLADAPRNRTGLLLDSVVMADNLATVRLDEISSVIGSMPSMEAIDQALRRTLSL